MRRFTDKKIGNKIPQETKVMSSRNFCDFQLNF